jgi:hypothetical protein
VNVRVRHRGGLLFFVVGRNKPCRTMGTAETAPIRLLC